MELTTIVILTYNPTYNEGLPLPVGLYPEKTDPKP